MRSWLGGDCGAIPFNGSQTLGNNWTRIQLNLDEDHFDAHDDNLIGIREAFKKSPKRSHLVLPF